MGKTVIIEGASEEYARYMPDVYRLRHQVFCDDKGWVSSNQQQQEIDDYDYIPPVYFVYVNDEDVVEGCCRILPTTGPNMLKDIFPELLGSKPMPQATAIWEISRFAVDTDGMKKSQAVVSHVTSELLIALFTYALERKLQKIVAVTDTAFERMLRRAGLYTVRYAAPRKYGNCEAVTGYADVSEDTIRLLEERKTKNERRRLKPYEQDDPVSGQMEITTTNSPRPNANYIA